MLQIKTGGMLTAVLSLCVSASGTKNENCAAKLSPPNPPSPKIKCFCCFCVGHTFFSGLIFSCWHFQGPCFFISSLFVVEDCWWTCQKMSSLELQTDQSQVAKRSSESCFMTLITSSFPYLCVFVYMCVRVCVYRVFPHLEPELCFPLGPFPCSVKSFLLPVSPDSPPPP